MAGPVFDISKVAGPGCVPLDLGVHGAQSGGPPHGLSHFLSGGALRGQIGCIILPLTYQHPASVTVPTGQRHAATLTTPPLKLSMQINYRTTPSRWTKNTVFNVIKCCTQLCLSLYGNVNIIFRHKIKTLSWTM